jgi:hypothetical protein
VHPTRGERALRAVGAASIATFVALFSHVAGGGTMPGFAGIAVPLALAILVCIAVGGRRLSLPRLSISVVISQLLFHFLFVLGLSGPATSTMPGGHAAHGAAHIDWATTTSAATTACDPLMWAAHALAAIVTITAMHQGARVAARLTQLSRRIWATLLPLLSTLISASIDRPILVVVRALPFVFRRRSDQDVASRRGPPVLLAS